MAFYLALIKIFYVLAVVKVLIKCQEESHTEEAHEPSEAQGKSAGPDFSTEWEEKMKDYDGDYVYLIPINYHSKEIFFENITKTPARIRGAILVDEEKKDKIDFKILDPKGSPVYNNRTSHAIFDFNVTESGRYYIVFENSLVNGEVRVTFTLCLGQNQVLKKDDLTHSEQKLDNLIEFIKRFNTENKLNRNRHRERSQSKKTT